MRYKLTLNMIAGVLISVFLASASPVMAELGESVDGYNTTTCVASNTNGRRNSGSDGRTLHYLLQQAANPNINRCREEIQINVENDTITLYEPVVIEGSAGSATDRLVIKGVGTAPTYRVTLSASGLDVNDFTDKPKCVVWVKEGSVTLQNINVTNVPEGFSGICVSTTEAVLENVRVRGASSSGAGESCVQNAGEAVEEGADAEATDGEDSDASDTADTYTGPCSGGADGIKFCEGAYRNVMVAPVRILNMAGCAINFGANTDDGWNSNRLIPALPNEVANDLITADNALTTTSELYSQIDEVIGMAFTSADIEALDVEQVDADGIIPLEDMSINETSRAGWAALTSQSASRIFSDSSNVHVCLSYKGNGPTLGTVEIRGLVLNGSESTSPVAADVKRLQVYTESGFDGFVAPAPSGYFGMQPSVQGDETLTGVFDIIMPDGHSDIILIPEDSAHRLGSPALVGNSPVIKVNAHVSSGEMATVLPCSDRDFGSADGGCATTGSCENGTDVRRLDGVTDCINKRGISGEGQEGGHKIRAGRITYDTDGDGLSDDREDSGYWDGSSVVGAFNCKCDEGESCFLNPDTDEDGILDGKGSETPIAEGYNKDGADYVIGAGEFACVGGYNEGDGKCNKWMDNDEDGRVNADDPDSDGDGRTDTIEDRNAAIASIPGVITSIVVSAEDGAEESRYNGFLYELPRTSSGSDSETNQFAMEADAEGGQKIKECRLTSNASPGSEYFYYFVDSTGMIVERAGFPQKVVSYPPSITEDEANAGNEIHVFACRAKAFASWKNFNGKYEDINNETNAYVSDPAIYEEGSPVKPCLGAGADDTVFFTTMFKSGDKYVTFSGGSPAWKIASDGRKLVFTKNSAEIASACYDSDTDGIPDCVEVPEGYGCKGTNTELNWNKPDSDEDGHSDGFKIVGGMPQDVCPTTPGEGARDTFSPEASYQYSCGNRMDALQWYRDNEDRKRAACFMDRDGDSIMDCNEDRNLNGSYDPSTMTSTPEDPITYVELVELESDPLSLDSDNDGLTDQIERTRAVVGDRYTNPGRDDSDGDTIKDGVEDANHDGSFAIDIIERGNDLCVGAFRVVESSADVSRRTGEFLLDTDPTNPDTDLDTLNDNVELSGEGFSVGQDFIDQIAGMMLNGPIPMKSNPRSPDSDGDGLRDELEYRGGVITALDSNPCMRDSDGDTTQDGDARENVGSCRLSVNQLNCAQANANIVSGDDTDGDRIPDWLELQTGTNPAIDDSDGDTIKDGEEDSANQNGIFEPLLGESDPRKADTDEDGLPDNYEKEYGTEVNIADTDGDGILDGTEDFDKDGKPDPTETNATLLDTDGDGLCDGNCRGIGEDMDMDGVRLVNPDGSWGETDPTNRDSDFDGMSDWDEMTAGGGWNFSRNIGAATTGREGCSVAGTTGMAPTSMFYLFGMLLIATRFARSRLKKNQIGEYPLLK